MPKPVKMEMELRSSARVAPDILKWTDFILPFGLQDEQLHCRVALDSAVQETTKLFANICEWFHASFEDASGNNDEALKWRLC